MSFASRISWLIPKGRAGRSIVALAGGTVMAQVITATALLFVTRLYTPAEIGIISLFLSFFAFWSQLLSWRYEYALFVARDDYESYRVFRLGISLVLAMSALSVPVLYGLIRGNTLGFGLLPIWSPLAGMLIFSGYGIFVLHRIWGLRSGLVRNVNKATVSRAASTAVVRVVLGFAGGGVAGLFAAEFAGAWGATAALHPAVRKHYSASRPAIFWQGLLAVMKRYSKFPKYDMPSTIIDQLALTLPIPIIASLYGAQAAGWFGLARMVVALPNAQLGRAVSDVFQMELAQKVRAGDFAAARRLFHTLLRKLSLFGLLPLAGVMILAPIFVPWVFGKPWAEAGIIMACIAPWLYAALVVSPLSGLISVLERQEYKFIYDISTLILIGLVYLAGRQWSLGLIAVVMLLAIANIIGYAIYLLIFLRIISRHLKSST